MEDGQWEKVLAAFDDIVVLPEAQRSIRLARIGQTDPRMRGMLEVLMHEDAIAHMLMSPPEPVALTPPQALILESATSEGPAQRPETPPADGARDPHEIRRLLETGSPATSTTSRLPRRRVSITTGSLWLSGLVIGLGAFALRRDKPATAPTWLDLDAPDSASARSFGFNPISLSPNGSVIAYVGGPSNALFVRSLEDARGVRKIEGSDNARCPSFSPDGRWILFTTDYHLVKIPASGGTPTAVVDSTVDQCALWIADKQILFERNASLFTVSPDGGARTLVARFDTLNDIRELHLSQVLPNGKAALVSFVATAPSSRSELGTLSLTDGKVTRLGKHGVAPRYANGYLLYGGAGLVVAPFSLRGMRVTGPETRLAVGNGQFTTSANDRLAYMDDGALGAGSASLVAVGTDGHARPLGIGRGVQPDSMGYSSPYVSPDGQRVALELEGGIWVYDLLAKHLTRLTDHDSGMRLMGWTKDSRRVVFLAPDSATSSPSLRVVRQVWDGSEPARDFIRLPVPATTFTMGPRHGFGAFSVVDSQTSLSRGNIWIVQLDTPNVAKPYVTTATFAAQPRMSHDGELLAYTSNESGRNEVYVRPLDASSPVIRISAGGGTQPVWSLDDSVLYYRGPTHLMRTTITRESPLSVRRRDVLFEDIYDRSDVTNYDVIPGDKELLMIQRNLVARRVGIVMDWPALLRSR